MPPWLPLRGPEARPVPEGGGYRRIESSWPASIRRLTNGYNPLTASFLGHQSVQELQVPRI
jgi:hypothetical protein